METIPEMKSQLASLSSATSVNARWVAPMLTFAYLGLIALLFLASTNTFEIKSALYRAIEVAVIAVMSPVLYIYWFSVWRLQIAGSPTLERAESLAPERENGYEGMAPHRARVSVDGAQISPSKQIDLEDGTLRLETLVDTVAAMLIVTRFNGQVEYANKTALKAMGLSLEAFQNYGWSSLIHPEDAARLTDRWARAARNDEAFEEEFRQRCANGQYRWWANRVVPGKSDNGEIQRWYCALTDIDDTRRIREALLASERHFRVMLDAIPALIWRAKPDGVVDYANNRCFEFHGLTIEQQANGGWQGLVHADDIELTERRWADALRTTQLFDTTYRFRRHIDGVYRWMHVLAAPLIGEDGQIENWYGIHIDVDELQITQAALAESKRHLTLIIETIPAMVWRARPNGELDYINRRCSDSLGMQLAELKNQGWLRAVHPDEVDATTARWKQSEITGETFEATYRFRFQDGAYRWMQASASPLRDQKTGQITNWYGIHVNVDEQKRAQNALSDSERNLRAMMETRQALEATLRHTQVQLGRASQIATVAELSASIAHEINQPLAAVAANGHACVRWLEATPPNLARATIAAKRVIADTNAAAEVVERVRALFKRAPPEKRTLDINDVVRQVLLLMQDEIVEKKVSAVLELDPELPTIFADRVQIQQTLINLVRNATEAMENVIVGSKKITLSSARDGPTTIAVKISDCGSGIEDVDRIFEPFFTTKERGMGVGLSICRSIIEAHGGQLWAAATSGSGTTFCVSLPVSDPGA